MICVCRTSGSFSYTVALMAKEDYDKKTVVTDHTEQSICEINYPVPSVKLKVLEM